MVDIELLKHALGEFNAILLKNMLDDEVISIEVNDDNFVARMESDAVLFHTKNFEGFEGVKARREHDGTLTVRWDF